MWLAFFTGLLGSMHCVGMCGAIALTLPSRTFAGNLLYNVGRVLSYTFIGLLFGIFGKGLNLIGVQQYVSIGLGVMIILAVLVPYLFKFSSLDRAFTKFKQAFIPFYKKKNYFSLLMIGILNGFLPCGLIYLAIIGSVVVAKPLEGALYMFLFGLGTLPMMLSLTIYKNILTTEWRRKIFRMMPAFVILVGILLIFKGLNLGIPYISPYIEPASQTVECGVKH
jgi:sulfite exporter TauE/SafE